VSKGCAPGIEPAFSSLDNCVRRPAVVVEHVDIRSAASSPLPPSSEINMGKIEKVGGNEGDPPPQTPSLVLPGVCIPEIVPPAASSNPTSNCSGLLSLNIDSGHKDSSSVETGSGNRSSCDSGEKDTASPPSSHIPSPPTPNSIEQQNHTSVESLQRHPTVSFFVGLEIDPERSSSSKVNIKSVLSQFQESLTADPAKFAAKPNMQLKKYVRKWVALPEHVFGGVEGKAAAKKEYESWRGRRREQKKKEKEDWEATRKSRVFRVQPVAATAAPSDTTTTAATALATLSPAPLTSGAAAAAPPKPQPAAGQVECHQVPPTTTTTTTTLGAKAFSQKPAPPGPGSLPSGVFSIPGLGPAHLSSQAPVAVPPVLGSSTTTKPDGEGMEGGAADGGNNTTTTTALTTSRKRAIDELPPILPSTTSSSAPSLQHSARPVAPPPSSSTLQNPSSQGRVLQCSAPPPPPIKKVKVVLSGMSIKKA